MITRKLNKTNQAPIGIFDSGVGGLSVLKAIQTLMPKENLIYLADTQYTPYGERSIDFINQRVNHVTQFLVEQGVKLIVIACNTATAASVQSLREQYDDLPIVGLEPAIKPAIASTRNRKVGVLATQATLDSDKYKDLKLKLCEKIQLIEKASPFFVELVESGVAINFKQKKLIEKELQPFIQAEVDSLVLGCTHFPFLTQIIQETIGEDVSLFDSAMPVAYEVERKVEKKNIDNKQTGIIQYFSSDPKKAKINFEKLLQQSVHVESLPN